jgi:RNA polymerase sigma-70 factor (ECF subfamily)
MSNDQSAVLQALLARWAQGDQAARQELIGCAYERLRRLAHVILNESFPRLKDAPALLQTTDVANEVALGMYQALAELHPPTVRDFFRLAAQRIRWLLLDRAKQLDRRRARPTAVPTDTPVAEPDDADPPALLTALYDQIEGLPTTEREVVDLLYFHGLSQLEAAGVMGVTERTVRRYWTAARLKLAQGLQDVLPPVAGGFLDA